jgi:hypothetical protein
MIESLSIAKNFVADARVNLVAPFKPEDIVLEDYNFVPFVRNGLSGAIAANPAGADLRAVVRIAFDVCGSGVASEPVARDLTLYGPGDVVGLDPGQIIRREPAPGTGNAEETFMAQIEFDRPDIPWMFSPLAPNGDRLEPWLALVVCLRDRSDILPPSAPGLPHVLSTELGELQSLEDNAYFAHAQVVDGAKVVIPANPAIADRLSDEHALANLSRLICPRKLEPGKGYRAVLVPAFDCGARAGLGVSGGTLGPAWTRAPDGSDSRSAIQLPAYDSWDFDTGPSGDFKSLAERLVPIGAPWQIGRRIIDGTQPGGGIDGAAPGTDGAVQVLSCALRSPATAPADGPSDDDPGWPAPLRDALRLRVEAANADTPLLPRVGPRLYARFQAARNAIGPVFGTPPASTAAADGHWFSQINTDPLSRIVAGLGTRVVQQDQELLMQAAWAQVSEINKLNHQIQQHQFARLLNESNMKRRIAVLDLGDLTRLTRPVHDRIRIAARPESLWKQIEDSRTAGSILSITAKRMTSVSAPAMRKGMTLRALARAPDFVADAGAFRDQRLAYANPDGITAMADKGLEVLGPELVGRVLGVAPDAAFATLRNRMTVLSAGTGVARLSGGVADWGVQPQRDVGGLFAKYLAGRIDTRAPNPADGASVLRAELAGATLAGLARVNAPEFGQVSTAPIAALAAVMPAAAVRRDIAAPIQPDLRIGAAANIAGIAAARVTPVAVAARANDSILARRGPVVVVRPAPTRAPAPTLPPAVDPAARFETQVSRDLTRTVSDLAALRTATLAQAFATTIDGIALPPARDTRAVPPLALTAAQIVETLAPARTMTAYLKGRVRQWPSLIRPDWFDNLRIDPVMAAPVFPRPMYEALDAYNRDWLVPGLGTIAQPDFVTLLEANPAFCETFLTGLSDEMGRELLWRNYPTDQRGTYFKRFWDAEQDELDGAIHRFSATPLGTHMKIGGTADPGFRPVVLVIRGAIVRRYPEAIIAAVRAASAAFPPAFVDGSEAEVLFHAHLQPDYLLVGFKLSANQVKAGNWWFLLAEHPTAPRFGIAEAPGGNPRAADPLIQQDSLDWNDLTALVGGVPTLDRGQFLAPHARSVDISDVGSVPAIQRWPGSSAVVARTLLRDPVRAAFEGKDLLTSIETVGGPNA